MPFPPLRTKMVLRDGIMEKKLRLVSLISFFQQSPLYELNKYGPCAVRTSAIHVGTWDFYKMISPDFVRALFPLDDRNKKKFIVKVVPLAVADHLLNFRSRI